MQRGHVGAIRLHVGGACSFFRPATKPAGQPGHISDCRHCEYISLGTGFQENFGEMQVIAPHRLAHPVPVRFRTTAHEAPHYLDVALSKRLGEPGWRTNRFTARFS
jgi:hypothetical protein